MAVGSVPATNRSRTGLGHDGPGTSPVGAHTVISVMPSGRSNPRIGRASDAASIASCQIGPAPSTPETSTIAEPSALPAHTPIARSGVKPIVQLSRNAVLVPLFTADGNGRSNGVAPPNPGMRASG